VERHSVVCLPRTYVPEIFTLVTEGESTCAFFTRVRTHGSSRRGSRGGSRASLWRARARARARGCYSLWFLFIHPIAAHERLPVVTGREIAAIHEGPHTVVFTRGSRGGRGCYSLGFLFTHQLGSHESVSQSLLLFRFFPLTSD